MRKIEKTPVVLDSLLERVLAGTHGEEEQIRAIRRAFEENLSFPTEAMVLVILTIKENRLAAASPVVASS